MLRNIKLSVITAIALVSIIGCGGGGSSSSSDVKTGTGYYVDSAVAGVEYVCGSKTGKTDADGKFTFEEGKECKFTLAGVPLRTTKADELADGKKIVEENPKVAKLLQSIDADGDLSNGIQVTDEVVEALTKALEETQSAGKLPEGDTLTEVVASVGHDVEGVSGEVRTDEEVEAHLAQTQTEVTKELLAGKTVYVVNDKEVNNNVLDKVTFSKDMTSITWLELEGSDKGEGGTDSLSLNGKVLTITPSDPSDGEETITITEIKKDYILATYREEDDGKVYKHDLRVYFDKEKAKAYSNGTVSNDLKTLLAGKTLYTTIYDEMGTLESWSFDDKFSSVTWKEIVGGNDTEVGTITDVKGLTFIVREDDDTVTISIKEKHDDYLVVTISDTEEDETETVRLYFDEAKARAYFGVAKVPLVPTKTISSSSDWNSVSPIYTDAKGDTALSGLDITAIKMAQDSENLYINLKRAGLNFPSSDYYYNYWIYFRAGDKTFSLENFHDNQGGYWFRIYEGIGYQGGTLVVDKMKTANTTDVNLQLVVPKSLNLIGKDISYTVSLFTHGFKDEDGKRDNIQGEKEEDSKFSIKF